MTDWTPGLTAQEAEAAELDYQRWRLDQECAQLSAATLRLSGPARNSRGEAERLVRSWCYGAPLHDNPAPQTPAAARDEVERLIYENSDLRSLGGTSGDVR